MDYEGQEIKLSKYYLSFEDYKDDPLTSTSPKMPASRASLRVLRLTASLWTERKWCEQFARLNSLDMDWA